MAYCGNCGAKLTEGVNFCENCGAKTSGGKPHCSQCGTELKEGAKFCPTCGTPTTGQPAPTRTQEFIQARAETAAGQQPKRQSFVVPDSQAAQKNKKKSGCGCGCLAFIAFLILTFLFYYSIYKVFMSGHHDGPEGTENAYELRIPTEDEFAYFYDDQLVSGVPDDAVTVTEPDKLTGYWKASFFIDPMGEWEKRFLNLDIEIDGTEVTGAAYWGTKVDSEGNSEDISSANNTVYHGTIQDGVLEMTDDIGNTVSIGRFYTVGETLYGRGSFNTADGRSGFTELFHY